MILLQDFVQNDSLIAYGGSPSYIRQAITNDNEFLATLVSFLRKISPEELTDYHQHDLRISLLTTFEDLIAFKPALLTPTADGSLSRALEDLKAALRSQIQAQAGSDFNEMLEKEIASISRINNPEQQQ